VIDWLDFVAPLKHDIGPGTPFYAGEVMATTVAGDLDWGIYKAMSFEGSHSAKIQVRSSQMDDGRPAIRVSGNVVKYFQGHNVFGSRNIKALVLSMIAEVCFKAGISPTLSDLETWATGDVDLLRVDVTESNDFGTLPRVLNAIRSLDSTANLKFRGRGSFNGHSLLFGKGSRHWSLTLYAKGAELEKHKLPTGLMETPLKAYADGLLRSEVRMLSMHLRKMKLHKLRAWSENTVLALHQMHLSKLSISEATMLDTTALEDIPMRLRLVYQSWKDGHDLRAMFPRATFYRYRTAMLKCGIDIAVKQERETAKTSNVVPLRVVLVGQPAVVPDWAMNTPLYFEPETINFRAREAA
jgi:II/X family phage/plasmid replication protein